MRAGSCYWLQSSVRALRGESARTGAALGSMSAFSSLERTVLAEPCSPDIARRGYGPPARNAASSQATTNTKSFRLARLRNELRVSIDPPRSGTGSGNIPAGRRKRTSGDPITRHPSGPIDRASAHRRDRDRCVRHAPRCGQGLRGSDRRTALAPCGRQIER